MIGMSLPFGPSPLGGGYGSLKMDHANLALSGVLDKMGLSNSPIGNALNSMTSQFTGMMSGLSGKSGNNLFSGLKTTMENLMPGADQLLSKFETVAMPALVTKTMADAIVQKTDDPQGQQQKRQKQQAYTPPGMNGPTGGSSMG